VAVWLNWGGWRRCINARQHSRPLRPQTSRQILGMRQVARGVGSTTFPKHNFSGPHDDITGQLSRYGPIISESPLFLHGLYVAAIQTYFNVNTSPILLLAFDSFVGPTYSGLHHLRTGMYRADGVGQLCVDTQFARNSGNSLELPICNLRLHLDNPTPKCTRATRWSVPRMERQSALGPTARSRISQARCHHRLSARIYDSGGLV